MSGAVPVYRLDTRPIATRTLYEDEVFGVIKGNINGWKLTPKEEEEELNRTEDEQQEMKLRIEAFQRGLIILHPVFICNECESLSRWEKISLYKDFSKIRCPSCSTQNELKGDDSKDYGQGKVELSCTLWRYEEADPGKHYTEPRRIITNEKDALSLIPVNANITCRQVVNLFTKDQLVEEYCWKMINTGPRVMTVTQLIKHDPELVFNALLHYPGSIHSVLAILNNAFMNRWQLAQFQYFYMKQPDSERFTVKRSDIELPEEYRSTLIEDMELF
jgi:hypothetical protein